MKRNCRAILRLRGFLDSLMAASAAVLFLILFGCSIGEPKIQPKDIDFVFSCKADVSAGGQSFTVELNRAGPMNATVKVVSGSGSGLAWYWNGQSFAQTYQGLSAESGKCVFPQGAFASVLVDALDEAGKQDALTRVGGNVFSGSCEDGDYTLTADGSTGDITQISVPGWKISAKLYGYDQPTLSTDVVRDYEKE